MNELLMTSWTSANWLRHPGLHKTSGKKVSLKNVGYGVAGGMDVVKGDKLMRYAKAMQSNYAEI